MNSAPVASAPVQSLAEMKKESSKAKKEKGGKSIGKSLLCGLAFGVVAGVVSFGIWAAAIHFWGEELGVVNVASNTPGTIEPDSGEPDSSEPESTQPTQPDNSPLIASTDAEAAIIGVVNEAMPSIVSINTTIEMDIYGTVQDVPASGSGFIYKQHEDEYLITTNYHVVEGAKEIVVQFNDGSTAPATLKGKKISMDVAVLSVKVDSLGESTKAAIRPATIGDSDKLQVGQTAVAIGNALGYGQSVTSGVISALNREYTTAAGETNKFIQTDAAINPGNSGGALLNLNGEVIGINSNKYADETVEGMGFAIPITAVKDIIDNLSDKQELVALPEDQQSLFGISGASVGSGKYTNTGIPIPQGVYVAGVTPGLAADQAGIMQGDIITEFDGNSLADMNELLEYLAAYPAGTEVKITYKRYEDTGYVAHETTVTLGSKQ
ncbi:MAG: trypsin-like peptidase domain-containing protein [Lachnospiraceae bacterium]|nr:trypsin-like peptidase domain-containing protein [Lachnospiraceae bacterium]